MIIAVFPQIARVHYLHGAIIAIVFDGAGPWIGAKIQFATVSKIVNVTTIIGDFHTCWISNHIQMSGIIFQIDFIAVPNDA